MGRFKVVSAGRFPNGEVRPLACELLAGRNCGPSFARSRSWDACARPGAPDLDFVCTACDRAAEARPVWPGPPMSAHGGVPDPAEVSGREAEQRIALADPHRMRCNRMSIFVNLPIASLDERTLQKRLEEIGRRRAAAAQAAPD